MNAQTLNSRIVSNEEKALGVLGVRLCVDAQYWEYRQDFIKNEWVGKFSTPLDAAMAFHHHGVAQAKMAALLIESLKSK